MIGSSLAWIALICAVVWSTFPILLLFASAFKSPRLLFTYPPQIFGPPTMNNFASLTSDWPQFWSALGNSIIVAFGSVLLALVVVMPSALAFSRYKGRSIRFSGIFLIVSRMFPPIVITIPLYPVLQTTGLMDKHIVLIVLYTAFHVSIFTWIMKSFIDNIPEELEESAFIEGCSKFQIFMKITLPLSTSGMVSISILLFIFSWNEFFFAFLFTTFNAVTAPVILHELMSSAFGFTWGPIFAGTAVQLVPVLLFVILVQKYLIRGLAYSSSK
jgi:multiple sugar transport system permease protein